MTKQQQTRLAPLIGHKASLLLPFVLLIFLSPFQQLLFCLLLNHVAPPTHIPGLLFEAEFPVEVSGGGSNERWDTCYLRLHVRH